MVTKFHDSVLGEIIIKRHPWASSVSVKMSVRGEIIATTGKSTPIILIKHIIRSKRREIEDMRQRSDNPSYLNSQAIGKSHRLEIVIQPEAARPVVETKNRVISVQLNDIDEINNQSLQIKIQDEVIKAHRREAKAYLPRRLSLLARRHGYQYQRTRLTHASTRWGSCSSNGTISLNIALMKLPLELIDYVLIHELCHSAEMNHSTKFWQLVAAANPDYSLYRRQLKNYSPSL